MEEVVAQTALPAELVMQVHPVMAHQQHQLACLVLIKLAADKALALLAILVLIKETLGKHLARLVEVTRAIL